MVTNNNGYSQVKRDSVNHVNPVSYGMGGSDSTFRYSFDAANPKAQKLMKEDFFWSPIEETAPFGSDDGSDAAYGFYRWRPDHKQTDPMKYLNELFARWNYPLFDRNELDSIKINMGIRFISGQDAAIIGTGFAQLVLEGMISPDLKKLTAIAIERQLLPFLLSRYPVDYQKIRKDQLTKMLYVISNCN